MISVSGYRCSANRKGTSSLWEPFSFLPLMTGRRQIQNQLSLVLKYRWTQTDILSHTLLVYMHSLITVMNGVHRQSVTGNKMNLWTKHVVGWDYASQPGSGRQRGGTDKKGLQTKEAITVLSLTMSAFQRPLSTAEETKTMPSVLLGSCSVTFIRCLGSVWGKEGNWGGGVGSSEGGVEWVVKDWGANSFTVQRVWWDNERVYFLDWNNGNLFLEDKCEKKCNQY